MAVSAEAGWVDHFAAVGGRVFLLPLEDLPYGGAEAAMACAGVLIGLIDGRAKEHLFFARAHLSCYPGSEPPAGAGQEVLLPGDGNRFDAPPDLRSFSHRRLWGLQTLVYGKIGR